MVKNIFYAFFTLIGAPSKSPIFPSGAYRPCILKSVKGNVQIVPGKHCEDLPGTYENEIIHQVFTENVLEKKS